MMDYVLSEIPLKLPIVVVTPNSECMKKARNFQNSFKKHFNTDDVRLAAFFRAVSVHDEDHHADIYHHLDFFGADNVSVQILR
jgi:hypothetical protein